MQWTHSANLCMNLRSTILTQHVGSFTTSKELPAKGCYSPRRATALDCILRCRLGMMPFYKALSYWILYISWQVPYIMEKQEASHCFKVVRQSWIPIHGSHRLWTYLVTIPLTGSISKPSTTCHLTLWQQSCTLYCSQSSLPWTNQAHRIGLPHCSWENSKWRNQDSSCANTIPSNWQFHQATACTPVPIPPSQVGSNWHSRSNLRGSVKGKIIDSYCNKISSYCIC
jgi:hypothetical protein